MKTRDEVEGDLSVLLDKPILTNWEVGQAIRILAGVMLDVQEIFTTPPRLLTPEEAESRFGDVEFKSAANAKYSRETLDRLYDAGEISAEQRNTLMMEAE